MIYALDPGPVTSAVVVVSPNGTINGHIWQNEDLLSSLRTSTVPAHSVLVIEQIASYGMPVGAEVFETVYWSGRFHEAWLRLDPLMRSVERIPRLAVKLALCHDSRAKDANIRAALIDRYGGKAATKKGGALYGIKADLWAALAVGVTYQLQTAKAGAA